MTRGERIVVAARDAVGTRFRAQGRGARGLDCIGLVALSLRAGGYVGAVRAGYALRSGDAARVSDELSAAGLRRVRVVKPGDVVVSASGPGQLHLGIATGTGTVHADAMLRRVVERPGEPVGDVIAAWRLGGARKVGVVAPRLLSPAGRGRG